jgi:acetyl esterase/lipase
MPMWMPMNIAMLLTTTFDGTTEKFPDRAEGHPSVRRKRMQAFKGAVSMFIRILWLAFAAPAFSGEPREYKTIEFARVGEHALSLDLFLPARSKPPLIIYIHGGAWRAGSRAEVPIAPLIENGFAIASVDYRLTPVAPFPANVHDIKAAIRFLRENAVEFGFDAQRFAIAGSSAGGHLAALVGVTNGVKELEGDGGGHRGVSSDVQAVVSFYGAANLQTILGQSTPHGLSVRVPALQLLLGGPPAEKPELARLASPVAHVNPKSPPILLIHGDADPQMPFEQSCELQAAYVKAGRTVELVTVKGGLHGGKEFYDEAHLALVAKFLKEHLR